MIEQSLATILKPLPYIIPFIVWGSAAFAFFYHHTKKQDEIYKKLIYLMAGFRLIYPALFTLLYYLVWTQTPFMVKVLEVSGTGYVFKYTGLRFWAEEGLAFLLAFIFWIFLKSLKRYRDRFFEEGEINLGALMVLVAGWPNTILFIPAMFIGMVITSLIRLIYWKQKLTTMGLPFLIACLLMLIFGGLLLGPLNLNVLRL